MQSVGLIGVGMIGLPMAQNILKGGFPLTAYDLDPGGSLKDQRLALAIAEACGVEAPVGRTVHELLRQTAEKYSTDDFCSPGPAKRGAGRHRGPARAPERVTRPRRRVATDGRGGYPRPAAREARSRC